MALVAVVVTVFVCILLTKSPSPKIYSDLLNGLNSFQLAAFFFLVEKKNPNLINSFLPLPPFSKHGISLLL